MPQITGSRRERTPIPTGEHILTLTEVKEHTSDNPFFKADQPESNQNQKQKLRLIWQFVSDQEDAEGNRYEYAEWTGAFYGDSRANLTTFLDQILPDADDEVKSNINTDTLIGRRFRARIQMRKNQKGESVPTAAFFEPIAGTAPVDSKRFDPDEVPF